MTGLEDIMKQTIAKLDKDVSTKSEEKNPQDSSNVTHQEILEK